MHFQKQDLVGTHYTWNEVPLSFNDQPSRRSFDKNNGDQVLFLINYYATLAGRTSLEECTIIEQTITCNLPERAKSEISAINWITLSAFATI